MKDSWAFNFTGLRIVVLGAHTSAVQFLLDRLPQPGEYLVARGSRRALDGAKGSNQAIAAARLGARVTLLTSVGRDEEGRNLLEYAGREGIDVSRVLQSDMLPSGSGVGFYLDDGTPLGATDPGATIEMTPEYVEANADAFNGTDVLLVSMEIPLDAVRMAIKVANSLDVRWIQLNPSPADSLVGISLPHVDALTPNEPELNLLAGLHPGNEAQLNQAARIVLGRYDTGCLAATLGSRGCFLATGKECGKLLPCPTVLAVDTSGAGDCFNSAFALSAASGASLEVCAKFAMHCASLSVMRRDSWSAFPSIEEVLAWHP